MKIRRILDVGIPFRKGVEKALKVGDELLRELQLETESSGAGFGYKDMQIVLDERSDLEIETIVKKVLKSRGLLKGAYWSIYKEDEEGKTDE